jgi:cytochrome P450
VLADLLPAIVFVFSTLLLIVAATRLLSGHPSEYVKSKDAQTVWMLPYWMPVVGHGFSFLYDPFSLMSKARDQSLHGIFALNLGTTTHNIISDPNLVKGVMRQKESAVQFQPMAWTIVQRLFGIPSSSKAKYDAVWEELTSISARTLMKEPYLGNMLKRTIRGLEENIPQMVSFMDSPIDQQPWERRANATLISPSEVGINLMSVMRDMMGHVSVPALFGRAYLENYPDILHDVYDMDYGMMWFLMGLPRWTPIPSATKAHLARARVSQSLNAFHRALDSVADGKATDSSWGDLDDVSELIMKRHALCKEKGFAVEERGDISILWAMVANANLLVFWLLLHILATPGLVKKLRVEIEPYAKVSKPVSINGISEAPKLELSHDGLAKKCPLFKSTYLEALRVTSQPWSVRQVATDVVISGDERTGDWTAYLLKAGEYVTVPHDIHMRDPKYFEEPEKFIPERFLVKNEDGTLGVEIGTIRPYGGGPSMCQGRIFAERECLSLVAGVLAFWDIEPADPAARWKIPAQIKATAVSLPAHETRVRIKRRQFDWEI